MIVLRDKHKDTFKHTYTQEQLTLYKEHIFEYINKYFIEI